jgi:hypothetical protein
LRAAAGSVLYLVLIALLALGVATAIRDTGVSIGAVLALLYLPRSSPKSSPGFPIEPGQPPRGHERRIHARARRQVLGLVFTNDLLVARSAHGAHRGWIARPKLGVLVAEEPEAASTIGDDVS